jgi:hypothetical protein
VAQPRTLVPAAEVAGTAAHQAAALAAAEAAEQAATPQEARDREKEYDADSVFAKLKSLKPSEDNQ